MKLVLPVFFLFSLLSFSQNTYITVDDFSYTHEQLVTDILIGNTCATVGNIQSSTGTDFGSVNGIGYFENDNPAFPITEGIILMTGNILDAPGPAGVAQVEGDWPGDNQLLSYIQNLGFDPGINSYHDASIIEFDFTPITDSISFNFVFASNEYGDFQCEYSDAFAFFLESQTTGVVTNLALVPNTPGEVPISVITIRDAAHNVDCNSQNPEYFGNFYGDTGQPLQDSPVNFFGYTVLMQAWSNVVPGETYKMKLVIADRNDPLFNSAVFIEGGSFFLGNVNLGTDLTINNGTARCLGENYSIDAEVSTPPTGTSLTWLYESPLGSGNFIPFVPAEISSSLVVTQTGNYKLIADFVGFCETEDTLFVEFDTPFSANPNPEPLVYCDLNNDGIGLFDLSTANDDITFGDTSLTVTYHTSEQNALNGTNPLPTMHTNTTPLQETLWARVQRVYSSCFDVVQLSLIVSNWLTDSVQFDEVYRLCLDASGNGIQEESGLASPPLIDTGLSTTQYLFTWAINGVIQPGETQSSIEPTQEGTYTVTVTDPVSGCESTYSTQVIVSSPPYNYDAIINTSTLTGNVITVLAEGLGEYQYSLDGGLLQDSNTFENVSPGNHIVTITDKNGCGTVILIVAIVDYPLYFTPNNDGHNDTWHIGGIERKESVELNIYDRFGKLITRLYPAGAGWDGTYRGRPLPSTDYWFHLKYTENGIPKELKGHFTLKR